LVVTSQCVMYDEKLSEMEYEFVDVLGAIKMNSGSAEEQYKKMMFKCCFAAGATAFKREVFEKYGLFNEKYKVIEDWSYFNYLNRCGVLIIFCDFGGLKHRDGGVSHNNSNVDVPEHVLAFKDDLLRVMEDEVIPYISILPIDKQLDIMYHYDKARADYYLIQGSSNRKKRADMFRENPQVYFRRFLKSSPRVLENILKFCIKAWAFSTIGILFIILEMLYAQTSTAPSWLIAQIMNGRNQLFVILTYVFVLSIIYMILFYIYKILLFFKHILKRFFAKGS
jgi:hypothetical protein